MTDVQQAEGTTTEVHLTIGPDGVPAGWIRTKLKSGETIDTNIQEANELGFSAALAEGLRSFYSKGPIAKISLKGKTGEALEKAKAEIMTEAEVIRGKIMDGSIAKGRRTSAKAKGISQEQQKIAKAIALRHIKDAIKANKKKVSSYSTSELSKTAESYLAGPAGPAIYKLAQETMEMLHKAKPAVPVDISSLIPDSKLVERNAKAAANRKAAASKKKDIVGGMEVESLTPKAPRKPPVPPTRTRPAPRPQA
jgi:hypothetical protein